MSNLFKIIIVLALGFFVWTKVLDQKVPTQITELAKSIPASNQILLPTAQITVSRPNIIQATQIIGGTLTLATPVPIVRPTDIPAATPFNNKYVECNAGSFYSCEDLEKLRQQARDNPEDDMHDAVVATDQFMVVPTTAPAVRQEYIDACNNTPKDKRDGFLKPICEGAGL